MTRSRNFGAGQLRPGRLLNASFVLAMNLGGLAIVTGLIAIAPQNAQVLVSIVGVVLLFNIVSATLLLWGKAPDPIHEEAFVSLILDTIDAAVTVYAPNGRLLRVNKGAERLSGYSEEERLDEGTWRQILPGTDFERVGDIVAGRRAEEYPIINENYWVSRAGERRLLRWSNVALKDAKGRITLVVCIGFDITELRRFEAELIAAKNEAELANRAKSEFLANMSHELRTPLNAILGFSEIMRDERVTNDLATLRRYASDINDSGGLLLQLINDILDMAKLESGRLDLDERELDLPAIVATGLRMVEQKAAEGGVKLSVSIAPGLPPMLGGERAVKQIVLNLLSNAVKFTPAGGHADVDVRLDDRGGVELAISDTGIGIPAESLERLFQPFYQVDAKISRSYGGTGLGLAITKKLVEAHGAGIAVKSSIGRGTVVTVSFPPSRTLSAFSAKAAMV